MFTLPSRLTAPPQFTNDTYMHWPKNTGQGAASMAQNPDQQAMDQQQLSQQQQSAVNGSGPGMMPLAQAMQNMPSPGLSRYLNKGIGTGTAVPGNPQPIRLPPRISATPQFGRLTGFKQP